MGIYHVGVSACLQTYAPFMLENKVAGASAGSLAAAALIGNVPLADMVRECVQLSCLASEKILGPFNPNFNINVSIKVCEILILIILVFLFLKLFRVAFTLSKFICCPGPFFMTY